MNFKARNKKRRDHTAEIKRESIKRGEGGVKGSRRDSTSKGKGGKTLKTQGSRKKTSVGVMGGKGRLGSRWVNV